MRLIHIIDDNQAYREILVEIIQAFGFWAKGFASGNRYLEYMALSGYQSPEVVFSDMNMPGKNGLLTIHEIRKSYPNIHCYIITGQPNQLSTVEIESVNGVLHKPLPPEKLETLLRSLC